MIDKDVNDFTPTNDPENKTLYMVTATEDFQIPYEDLIAGAIRSNGAVAVGAGTNVINFSSPFKAGTNYSLIIYDASGIGVEVTAQTVNGFTLESLGAGNIGYIAIKNI